MAYGNNRAGTQRRAHFQLAGGSIIKFKHPYLAGQIDVNSNLDEIDISACCKLEGTYFEATPNQDSAKQVVMIDGSTATISNRLLNGTISLPIIRTTGLVGTGDFISACQLIRSVGDSVGGSFDQDGTFAKSSYKVSEQAQLNQITDNNTLVEAIGINDYSIGKLTSLTTSAKTNLVSAINELVTNKVDANTAITGATKCKITYDSKGLVTSGADLSASDIPDLSSTYQTLITSSNKLSADLVDDTSTTNKFVTAGDKTTWNGKQDQLVSGTNIKTINSTSLLGSGDIEIVGLPSQTSQNNKYLTTNGTTASWADVPAVATFYWGE